MKTIILVASLVISAYAGHIQHSDKATSYQTFELEHHHAVPTYLKGDDAHYLKHPVSKGKTSSKVEVHHGGKHDHGYAIAHVESNLGHGYDLGGEHSHVQYVQDQGQQQYVQYQAQAEEPQQEQQKYISLEPHQYQQYADAVVAKLVQQGYAPQQGVGHYQAYQQRQ